MYSKYSKNSPSPKTDRKSTIEEKPTGLITRVPKPFHSHIQYMIALIHGYQPREALLLTWARYIYAEGDFWNKKRMCASREFSIDSEDIEALCSHAKKTVENMSVYSADVTDNTAKALKKWVSNVNVVVKKDWDHAGVYQKLRDDFEVSQGVQMGMITGLLNDLKTRLSLDFMLSGKTYHKQLDAIYSRYESEHGIKNHLSDKDRELIYEVALVPFCMEYHARIVRLDCNEDVDSLRVYTRYNNDTIKLTDNGSQASAVIDCYIAICKTTYVPFAFPSFVELGIRLILGMILRDSSFDLITDENNINIIHSVVFCRGVAKELKVGNWKKIEMDYKKKCIVEMGSLIDTYVKLVVKGVKVDDERRIVSSFEDQDN